MRGIFEGTVWEEVVVVVAYPRSSPVWMTARVMCMDEDLAPTANRPQTTIIGVRRMPDTRVLG